MRFGLRLPTFALGAKTASQIAPATPNSADDAECGEAEERALDDYVSNLGIAIQIGHGKAVASAQRNPGDLRVIDDVLAPGDVFAGCGASFRRPVGQVGGAAHQTRTARSR